MPGYHVFRRDEMEFAPPSKGDQTRRLQRLSHALTTSSLAEPPERVAVPQGPVVVVAVGTPIQLVNEGDADSLVLIVGAPLVLEPGEYLPDVPPPGATDG
jgi:hypothetical protein